MKFKYKALDKNNEVLVNIIDLDNEKDVVKYLYDLDLKPIVIQKHFTENKSNKIFKRKISNKSLQILLYKLYIMISSGLTLPESIKLITYEEKDFKTRLIYSDILDDLHKGETFTSALTNKKYFPEFMIRMIETAEKTANLKKVFYNLHKFYENKEKFDKKIKSALYYPILLIFVCIIIVNFLCISVLPNFIEVLQYKNLPLSTRILLKVSGFINNNFILLVIFNIFITLSFVLFYKTDQGKEFFSKILLKIPIYKLINIKNFVSMVLLLLENNRTLYEAINITVDSINNIIVKNELKIISSKIRDGMNLSEAMEESNFFPEFCISMVKVSESSSKTQNIFKKLEQYYIFEISFRQERFIKILEPLIIIIMAIIVGYIVLSISIPMFDIVNGM